MKNLIIISSIVFFLGCSEEKAAPDCGCEAKTTDTIPESESLTGAIYYKTQQDPNDTYYNNRFWINLEYDAGVHFLIVCNEEMVSNLGLDKNSTYTVTFTGNLKELCEKTGHTANDNYDHIVLTKIEIQ